MASQLSAFEFNSALPHLHVLGDVCPLCEQPIPHDKFDEIKDRIESRERDHVNQIAQALQSQFAEEKRKLQELAARDADERVAAAAAAAKRVAEEAASEMLNKANAAREKAQQDLEQAKVDAIAREAQVRADAVSAAQASVETELKQHHEARLAAEAKATIAETSLRTKEEEFKEQLAERLEQQREALETAKITAVNQEKAAAIKERMKLHEKVQLLERALEKKSNEELGEGAEVNLYDALRNEFPDDRIERIGKGQSGADIRHVVVHNGRDCGTILYDSKNHAAWRSDFVKKLASDQMAERAEHSILSTCVFPAGVRQVHVQSGVIISNPARVCALAQILRQHIIHTSTLKLSAESRTQKTAALYEFITSEPCRNLLNRIDQVAEELLDLQVSEQKAHTLTWRKQGELYRAIQKTRGDLCAQIDNIVSEPMQ